MTTPSPDSMTTSPRCFTTTHHHPPSRTPNSSAPCHRHHRRQASPHPSDRCATAAPSTTRMRLPSRSAPTGRGHTGGPRRAAPNSPHHPTLTTHKRRLLSQRHPRHPALLSTTFSERPSTAGQNIQPSCQWWYSNTWRRQRRSRRWACEQPTSRPPPKLRTPPGTWREGSPSSKRAALRDRRSRQALCSPAGAIHIASTEASFGSTSAPRPRKKLCQGALRRDPPRRPCHGAQFCPEAGGGSRQASREHHPLPR